MTELSPQVQAVLDAAISVCHPETEVVAFQCTRLEVAAALRAVADRVVPENRFGPPENAAAAQREITRADILAIADELESSNA